VDVRQTKKKNGSRFLKREVFHLRKFKDRVVQIYQYGIDGLVESLTGELKHDIIIFKKRDGELRHAKQDIEVEYSSQLKNA